MTNIVETNAYSLPANTRPVTWKAGSKSADVQFSLDPTEEAFFDRTWMSVLLGAFAEKHGRLPEMDRCQMLVTWLTRGVVLWIVEEPKGET